MRVISEVVASLTPPQLKHRRQREYEAPSIRSRIPQSEILARNQIVGRLCINQVVAAHQTDETEEPQSQAHG